MKKDIHPKYKQIKVTCSCGNSFVTSSTLDKDVIHLEVCSECHPFYTGKQKLVDTAGRVDKFKQRYTKTKEKLAKTLAQAKEQKIAQEEALTTKKKSVKKVAEAAKTKKS